MIKFNLFRKKKIIPVDPRYVISKQRHFYTTIEIGGYFLTQTWDEIKYASSGLGNPDYHH